MNGCRAPPAGGCQNNTAAHVCLLLILPDSLLNDVVNLIVCRKASFKVTEKRLVASCSLLLGLGTYLKGLLDSLFFFLALKDERSWAFFPTGGQVNV